MICVVITKIAFDPADQPCGVEDFLAPPRVLLTEWFCSRFASPQLCCDTQPVNPTGVNVPGRPGGQERPGELLYAIATRLTSWSNYS